MELLFFLIASLMFGGISYRLNWLSLSGSVAASLFGFCLLWLGGAAWVVPLIVFFASSSILSKVGQASAKKKTRGEKREDVRNAYQVLANGGVAWVMLLLHAWDPQPIWYAGFIGSLAAATADTWATEIGRLGGGRPRHILTGALVQKGLSGGITWQGTLGSFLGAAIMGVATVPFYDNAFLYCIILGLVAGALGSVIDSIAGATLQAKYRDPVTHQLIEKPPSSEVAPVEGVRFVTNDVVNVICTLAGSVIAILFVTLI